MITICFVSSNQMNNFSNYIIVFSTRLLFLHEGRVVWEGTTSEFDTSQEPIVRQVRDAWGAETGVLCESGFFDYTSAIHKVRDLFLLNELIY